jgi:trehalose-6-phosphate synthase
MTDAIVTNPYHVDGVAADLDRALRATREERIERHVKLRRVVDEDTAAMWAKRFRELLNA